MFFVLQKEFEEANLPAVISEVVSQTPAPTTHSAGLPPDTVVSSILEIGFCSSNKKTGSNGNETRQNHWEDKACSVLEEIRLAILGR